MEENTKEELRMKNLLKLAAVGIAGYLVGFYEMKYKTNKALLDVFFEREKRDAQK